MKTKQEILVNVISAKLENAKVGVIVRGITEIDPVAAIDTLSQNNETKYYVSAVGYNISKAYETDMIAVSHMIEDAVRWRSEPALAGKIIAFVKSDSDKLHSLAEFDEVTTRDLSLQLIEERIAESQNAPCEKFWNALKETSSYYSFDILYEFIEAVCLCPDENIAIPMNMWHLGLLCDSDILNTNIKPDERLSRNRELIIIIGQLSDESRKKISSALTRSSKENNTELQTAYRHLQEYFKYGRKDTLKQLSYNVVQQLFVAPKSKKKKDTRGQDDPNNGSKEPISVQPLKTKEIDKLIADIIVDPTDEDLETLRDFFDELEKRYDESSDENKDNFPTIGGAFENRPIVLDNHNSQFRRIIGTACSQDAWGGVMFTEEGVLRDAMASDYESFIPFVPMQVDSKTSFDGSSLFEFIRRFDEQFAAKKLENVEAFTPIIKKLSEARNTLVSKLDLVMYHPILSFGINEKLGTALEEYMTAWTDLLRVYCRNEIAMHEISPKGAVFIARSLLLLDVLYVKTPTEWKGMLLPTHPLFLWRYYEVFKELKNHRDMMSEEDANDLTRAISNLPQMLNFIVVDKSITNSISAELPCSGSIEMLPTYENKTNRYLGYDGTQSIPEILSRWVAFAPYTSKEVRICTVDAPDMPSILKAFKESIEKGICSRIVYDAYLTRSQNGNSELAKLDYMISDYEVGEYIKSGKISISIQNLASSAEIKRVLDNRPVHLAFYFDQSSYSIEYGPTTKNLYISPLVVTYDYDFDEITQRGEIFPSSNMESGMIGDYHKMLRFADIVSNDRSPRPTYNPEADISAVLSTIRDSNTQWLIAADRTTSNYLPIDTIPIGEKQYGKRMVSIWSSRDSRIISQYQSLLRQYNLHPKKETLIDILSQFGHISSEGLISIPRYGADAQAIDNRKKGLIGTVFAATWYSKMHKNSLVASLDTPDARQWLNDSHYPNDRADLIGLYYNEEKQTLHVQPIEVKTRDESPDAIITVDEKTGDKYITGHAADQVAAVVRMLREIFGLVETDTLNMFVSARREVLKYQIVSECFRDIHDPEWQKEWSKIFKKAFAPSGERNIKIDISGVLVHVKLSEAIAKKPVDCINPKFDDCPIRFVELTSKEIQEQVLGNCEGIIPAWTSVDYDDTETKTTEEEEQTADMLDNSDNTQGTVQVNDDTPASTDETSEVTADKQDIGEDATVVENTEAVSPISSVPLEEIEQLVSDFKKSCRDYHIQLKECCAANEAVVGPSVIRIYFKLARGQGLAALNNHLEDISREMKRSGVLIQQIQNSDKLILDVPRLSREMVSFAEVIKKLPVVDSPEKLYFPLGRTPEGKDIIKDISELPHLLVGGSTGSGKTVFLFTMLAALLKTHPTADELQIVLSSSGLEDFIHFEGIPHLVGGKVISDAEEATELIKSVVFTEFERREKILTDARVANIAQYNQKCTPKLAPMVVVIDEFADLADQLETKKEKEAFFTPVKRIAQIGRKRGIHLVLCTQRPAATLVPSNIKSQLSGRLALRVNDANSSRMILEESGAQYLQKHGDMIYKNGAETERAQGYFISIDELDEIVEGIKRLNE